jgi:4-diphosphocytidyl-2-C-methyl-D-erythritol kinase
MVLKNKLNLFKNNRIMICFPNAKINIGLHVTGKRDDGYHNIETLFYPVQLTDILEIIPLSGKDSDRVRLINSGIKIDIDASDNLCIRAWRELHHVRPLPPVEIHLHKIIPHGAGLGGGSSNAASVLMTLNELFDLNIANSELALMAGRIGSDCPFFIYNKPVFAKGRGDILEPAGIDLSGYRIVIVHPGKGINTAWAYSMIKITNRTGSLMDLLQTDPLTWQGRVINDFETAVFDAFPMVNDIRQKLIGSGAFYASLTGSGSAVYGLFDGNTDIGDLKGQFQGMFVWEGIL